jgi:CHASE2 domain-containing sensor protein
MQRDLKPPGHHPVPSSPSGPKNSSASSSKAPMQHLPFREGLLPIASALIRGRQRLGPVGYGHLFMGMWVLLGAIATTLDIGLVQLLERQTQAMFFQIRGTVDPPDDLIILAIDEQSLGQGEIYSATPDTYPYLEPLQSWPWQRRAYGIAVENLMDAGARAVALGL